MRMNVLLLAVMCTCLLQLSIVQSAEGDHAFSNYTHGGNGNVPSLLSYQCCSHLPA